MAYEEVTDLYTETTIALGEKGKVGETIEGYYLGYKLVDGDYGPCKVHAFKTQSGDVGVWGKTLLDKLLKDEHKGFMCLVTFTGMIPPKKKGRRPAYSYRVQVDRDKQLNSRSAAAKKEAETYEMESAPF